MDTNTGLVPDSTCNICMRPIGGSAEDSCLDHHQIAYSLHNQKPDYKDYQQFLIQKKRQQEGLPSLEFQPRVKNW